MSRLGNIDTSHKRLPDNNDDEPLTSTMNDMRRASIASNQEPLASTMNEMRRASTASNQGASGQVSSPRVNIKTKWQQYGTTIAGGNCQGKQLNQLSSPYGIYIDDDDQCIYIADCDNHRILEWKYNAEIGQTAAGGNGYGNRMDQLNGPTDMIVDQQNDSLIICDLGNRRVVRWFRRNATKEETIISDVDCYSLTMDNYGDLYISDFEQHEVRRWKIGETNGIIVAGGNGKGNHLNQLNQPTSLFMKGANEGIVVAGGQGEGNSLTQLSYPEGVFVDHWGHVYVADSYNHRIMRWLKGSKEGRIIVGGNGKGEQPNQFNLLRGLSIDRQGNLYVADNSNHRVQKFEIDLN
ncbi:unnamed protein product [Rotaria sp. Silwood2]|nr:unnamed protein product [Rotaria sp. Silwood2]CAF2873405.1 unnamed protein product [Rotaria sp. Silwood2]CAF3296390.1 unnamed protein product [Rotaria sp. Silwood2]CAF4204942.1 unnamed protein product [Rotaria sp. Silwood2]CAF4347211.1 unnamed protein product [Rotaria sp. Silwood2]